MVSLANPTQRAILAAVAVVIAGAAFYVSFGLQPVWWLVWLAPLPVLLVAPGLRAWQALLVAFAARALGALNLYYYMHHDIQIPLPVVVASVLIPAGLFALGVLLYRGLLNKSMPWLAVLAFPVTIVAAEYLLSLSQGTFGNTGYTQLKFLPILQLAALTGLWGISFTVNLLPAALAALIWVPAKLRARMAVAFAACYLCVLSYGVLHLRSDSQAPHSVIVGLVETHAGQDIFPPDAPSTMAMYRGYAEQVKSLAAQGAQFVILPEMTALIPDSASTEIDAFFQQTAREAHVQILLGVLHLTDHGTYNEGRLYSANGEIETVYRKHHLVPSFEARTSPGSGISVLSQPSGKIGIEICRDMDYPGLARRYAHQDVGLVLVPAWDQGVDALWHGHMALMRSVEDGFTLVRDAKVGLLTAADDRGRIIEEKSTREDGGFVTMLAAVPVRHDSTLYQEWGDWFAWIDLVALAVIVVLSLVQGRNAIAPAPSQ